MDQIADIRLRVIETEKVTLKKKAARLYPNDAARQDKYVYQKLSAKYGFRKNENQTELTPRPPLLKKEGENPVEIHDPALGKRLTLEELVNLPLEGCTISFTIVNSLRPGL